MIYLTLIKTLIWDNKIIRNIFLGLLLFIILYFSYQSFYKSIYNKGYNEAVKITQKDLNNKYNIAVEKIKKENLEQSYTENKKLEEAQKTRDLIQKQYNETNKKLNELIKNSKSNLVNKECKADKKEVDFFNDN